ncbi:hypothetical protein AX15_001600 [Amanita polypyramis BW_CC]|nr:hypothetical protein AX15_001600 [Amanita polypyramis BW_CC]
MTSRVQKGGPIFRPISHVRARASSTAPRTQPHNSITHTHTEPPQISISPFTSQSHEQISHAPQFPSVSPRDEPTWNAPAPLVLTSQRTGEPVLSVPPTPISVPQRTATQQQQPPRVGAPTPIALQDPSITTQQPLSDTTVPTIASNTVQQLIPGRTEFPVLRDQKSDKRRRRSGPAEDEQIDPETAKTKRSRRGTNGTSGRRSRGPSLPPYDYNADPGEELDPTVVTMATLCEDIGQGRVSSKAAEILSNHAAWKARNREKRARMRTLMELKKYGRENESESETQGAESSKEPTVPQQGQASGSVAGAEENEGGFDYTQGLASSRFNVQVRIGPNGETIIDEESLVVDRAEAEDTQVYTHVVESDMTKFINSASYSKRFRGSRWSAEETERFYDALSQYGENYELIAYVLPGRDRKSCKNKFKMEDKKNPARINYSLNNRIPVDVKTLSRMTGKDFSGPVPEIRVPTPGLVEVAKDSAISEITKDSHLETSTSAPKGGRRGTRSRNTEAEEGVVIVGSIEDS